ncbi:cohesin domain-containing protein [Candidatus Amarobacter glycogenicus]|uniref:cohesin domain-containing protein n=1 Tax=Candidatus Amarobacter glycogenicus TaxID=3140699 RepID=UPI002A109714|nr:hypothetical protein [Dehalococcoidia bacterium]
MSAGAILALSGLGAVSAQQDVPATLAFSPVPAPIEAGQQATYVLGIANATRLFGADIEISFDPKAVAIVDADPAKEGVQVRIGPFLDPGFVVYNVADNAAGKLRVTFTQVAPRPAANGNGGILSFDLKATGGGDPALKVSAALLARNDGSPQPVSLPSTGVTPAAPQGSPVPNPTQIPGPTTAAATAARPHNGPLPGGHRRRDHDSRRGHQQRPATRRRLEQLDRRGCRRWRIRPLDCGRRPRPEVPQTHRSNEMNQRQRRGVSLATLLATIGGVGLILMTMVLGAGAQGTTAMTTSSGTITAVGLTTTTNVRVTIDNADSGFIDAFDIRLADNQGQHSERGV